MAYIQGKYRLTFPITPHEVNLVGYGNSVTTYTTIEKNVFNEIESASTKSLSMKFLLPYNDSSPAIQLVEVSGYAGAREWLNGIDRLRGESCLLFFPEIDLFWNVYLGSVDSQILENGDMMCTISFHLAILSKQVILSKNTEILSNPVASIKNEKTRNSGNAKKKKNDAKSKDTVISRTIQLIEQQNQQREKIKKINRAEGT